MTVGALLFSLARSQGDDSAYLDARDGSAVSWRQLADEVRRWSDAFAPGSIVGLRTADPVAFARAYVAGIASGVCVAPMDPRSTADETAQLIETLRVTDLVTDGPSAESVDAPSVSLWASTPSGLERRSRVWSTGACRPGTAVLLATSGSTGSPKLVPLTEGQLVYVAQQIVSHHGLTRRDRGYSPLPLFHVNGQVVGLLSTLLAGSSLVLEDRFRRASLWSAAEELHVTWLNLVPAILSALAEVPGSGASVAGRVRFARSASSPLPVSIARRFEARTGIGVLETYGMTEAAGQFTSNPLEESARRRGSVGRAVGVALRVVDDDGHRVPDGDIGHVEICGPSVIDAYLAPDGGRRSARGPSGWLQTGDLGCLDPDGYVYLVGRADDVINRGGEKCYPSEVEEVLSRSPLVRAAAVVGRPHPTLGSEPVAYVVPARSHTTPTDGVLVAELMAMCQRNLTRYKQPAGIQLVETLPISPTGKVARGRLRRLATLETAGSIHHPQEGPIP